MNNIFIHFSDGAKGSGGSSDDNIEAEDNFTSEESKIILIGEAGDDSEDSEIGIDSDSDYQDDALVDNDLQDDPGDDLEEDLGDNLGDDLEGWSEDELELINEFERILSTTPKVIKK